MSSLWNYTIQDNSPFLAYAPFADGGLAHGWQPWYSKSGFLKSPGEGGDGDSFHSTALPGASFSLQFHGTGVNLYATTNSSYDVTVDNVTQKTQSQSGDMIFHTTSLKDGAHNLTLTVKPSKATEQFSFDHAVVFAPVKEIPVPAFYDNTDPKLAYTGSWKPVSAPGIPNATVTHPYEQTSSSGSSVSMNFTGAVGVAINGPVNWGDWVYSVELDGKTTKYNGSTYWKVPDALRFFQAGLDPNTTYSITLANPSAQMTLSLNSIVLYMVPGAANNTSGPASSSASRSASISASSGSSSAAVSPSSSSAGATGNTTTSTGESSPPSSTGTSGASTRSTGRLTTVAAFTGCLCFLALIS
ncbi:hypothetical protein B0H17DRAFT_1063707 [Mycena rosella]|uniref:Uncharacterized protein n=1 Tax=Mycena rosella TaxID=1033263 RepID=A0AAD7DH89_MYCRO|nr:hypothetical protein B0H17DRAFT_1063707 [Mycena rosella]